MAGRSNQATSAPSSPRWSFWRTISGGRSSGEIRSPSVERSRSTGGRTRSSGCGRTSVSTCLSSRTASGLRSCLNETPFGRARRGTGWLSVVARIRENVSRAQAQAELTAQARALATAYASTNREKTDAELDPISTAILGPVEPILTMLGAALSGVLLIACGNVANLLLAAGARRRREFAVRAAMGAPEFRLARQVALEAALLCAAAAMVAVALAPALVRMFLAIYPTALPRAVGTDLNLGTIAAAALLTLIGSMLLAAPQIVQGRRRDIRADAGAAARFSEGRRERSLRGTLVAAQVALSFTLIVAGISFVRTLERLQEVDTGYRADGVLTFVVNPPPNSASAAAGPEFYDCVVEDVQGVPGVRSVAAAVAVPLTTSGWRFGIRPSGSQSAVLVGVNMTMSAVLRCARHPGPRRPPAHAR